MTSTRSIVEQVHGWLAGQRARQPLLWSLQAQGHNESVTSSGSSRCTTELCRAAQKSKATGNTRWWRDGESQKASSAKACPPYLGGRHVPHDCKAFRSPRLFGRHRSTRGGMQCPGVVANKGTIRDLPYPVNVPNRSPSGRRVHEQQWAVCRVKGSMTT